MKRSRTLVLICCLALLGLPSASSAASGLDISFDFPDGRSIGLGAFLDFEITVENTSQEAVLAEVTLTVGPEGHPDPVAFERIFETFSSGTSVTRSLEVSSGQWFGETGRFELTAEHPDGNVTETFDVVRAPRRVPTFEEISASAGTVTEMPDFVCGTWSAGAAWGDVDGDGDLDLFLPRRGLSWHMWINEGGAFVDEAAERGLAGGGQALGATFADYDNDGDQDLYVAVDGPNHLYENDGTGRFEERAAEAGVDNDGPSQSASWGDVDRDGDLDLYVTNYARCTSGGRIPINDVLYRNKGNGTFADATVKLSLPESWTQDGSGFQAVFTDYDLDGDSDILVANDYIGVDPKPNILWRNDTQRAGPFKFTDVSIPSGINFSMSAMGIGASDYDRDGDFDYVISNIGAAVLFKNGADGRFENTAQQDHVDRSMQQATRQAVTWGAVFGDFNNDTWEDLYLPAGHLNNVGGQPNAVFTNWKAGKGFLDHSAGSGADDNDISRGVAIADYDRDGRIDLFVVNQVGVPRFYRNTTKQKKRHWLEVDTVGRSSNRDGCGSWVKVKIRRITMVREVYCGGVSLGSGNDHTVHFGLGRKPWVKRLVVKFPSGKKKVKTGFRADRLLRIREPK